MFKTNANGAIRFQSSFKVSGGDFYTDAFGKPAIPAGSVTIQETKAPYGYQIDSTVYKAYFVKGSDGNIHAYKDAAASTLYGTVDTVNQLEDLSLISEEQALKKGGISVQKKDSKSGTTPQGGTSFAGIQFTISLAKSSEIPGGAVNNAVVIGGRTYSPGDTVMTITTNAAGFAATAENALPYAYYTVTESSVPASTGMVNSGWKATVQVTEGTKALSAENSPKMFGISGTKLDSLRNAAVPSGDASLFGAEVSIYNRSANAVYVGGVKYEPGSVVARMTTSADGRYSTGSAVLPYGTYELKETKVPTGYMLNSSWSYTFTAGPSDANLKMFEVPAANALKDRPVLQKIAVVKWDRQKGAGNPGEADPRQALEGIRFEVVNRSNNAVVYGGAAVQPGGVVTVLTTAYDPATKTYRAVTSDLPYGRYDVRELYDDAESRTANRYYLVDSEDPVRAVLHSGGSEDGKVQSINFTDTRIRTLTVKKTVSGNMGNRQKDFTFELSLAEGRVPVKFEKTCHDGSVSEGIAGLSSGKFRFSLRHGETITFSGIISGSAYSVRELDGESEGYTVTAAGETEGTLDTDMVISVENSLNTAVPAGAFVPAAFVPASAAAVLGAVYTVRRRKREK